MRLRRVVIGGTALAVVAGGGYAAWASATEPDASYRTATATTGDVAQQPWLAKLKVLDLSMGTLGDAGAEALLASPYIKGLGALSVNHHYISPAVAQKLQSLGLVLSIDAPEEADEGHRYVEVGE